MKKKRSSIKSFLLLSSLLLLSACKQAPPLKPPSLELSLLSKVPVSAIAQTNQILQISDNAILAIEKGKTIKLATARNPRGIASKGNLFFCDDNQVFELSGGKKKVFAGTGTSFFPVGDGGPATSAQLNTPSSLAFDESGNLFVADTGNNRIRKIDRNGLISTFAGSGLKGFAEGRKARLNEPTGLAADEKGNLFFCDTGNNAIRKVDKNGEVSTVAGNGNRGFSGDGGEARAASLDRPTSLVLHGKDIFFADSGNGKIRWIDEYGRIATVAGKKESPLDNPVLGGKEKLYLGDRNGLYLLTIK